MFCLHASVLANYSVHFLIDAVWLKDVGSGMREVQEDGVTV